MSSASLCAAAVWTQAGSSRVQAHHSPTVSALSCHPVAWRASPDLGLLKGSAPACVTFTRPLLAVLLPPTTSPTQLLHCSHGTRSQQLTQPPFTTHALTLHKPAAACLLPLRHLSTRPPHLPLSTATGAISVISTTTASSSPQPPHAQHHHRHRRHHDAPLRLHLQRQLRGLRRRGDDAHLRQDRIRRCHNPPFDTRQHLHLHIAHAARPAHQPALARRPAPRLRREAPEQRQHNAGRLRHPAQRHPAHGAAAAWWNAAQEDPLQPQDVQGRCPAHRRRLRLLQRPLLRQAPPARGPQVRGP